MSDRWYEKAVIYCLDIDTFADSNGDGVGDIRGLIGRLDYLARLGRHLHLAQPDPPDAGPRRRLRRRPTSTTSTRASAPSATSPSCCTRRGNRGIKVIIDLVVNHTSDQHPWFQSARSSPDSPYRDWYVWSETEPAGPPPGHGLPRRAGRDLDATTAPPSSGTTTGSTSSSRTSTSPTRQVREEIKKICAFWLQLGVAGFRMDAVPFIIEQTEPGNPDAPKDFEFLTELRQHVQWRKADAVLLAEANVEAGPAHRRSSATRAARPTGSTCCSTSCSTAG